MYPTVSTKKKRPRRSFTAEFKAEAVRLVLEEGMSVSQVARDLDLTDSALRNWVKQAEIDAGKGAPGEPTSEELRELRQLRNAERQLEVPAADN